MDEGGRKYEWRERGRERRGREGEMADTRALLLLPALFSRPTPHRVCYFVLCNRHAFHRLPGAHLGCACVANALARLTFPAPPWDCPQRPDIAPPGVDTSQVRVSRKSVGKTQGILEPGRGLVMGPGVAVGELRLVLASACAEYTSRSRDPRKVCIFIHRLSTRPFGSLP